MFMETGPVVLAGQVNVNIWKCNFVCIPLSIGGIILERTVSDPNLAGIIVYAPIINGESF